MKVCRLKHFLYELWIVDVFEHSSIVSLDIYSTE